MGFARIHTVSKRRSWKRSFAYLYVIRVEFGARQAVERAEVQATREDSVRTAALPATKIPTLVQSNPFPLQNNEIRTTFSSGLPFTFLIRKHFLYVEKLQRPLRGFKLASYILQVPPYN